MPTRMKVKCNSIATFESYYQNSKTIGATVKFSFVSEGSEENKAFWDATPSGTFEVTINNEAAIRDITTGKEYYLDLSPAP